MKRKILHMLQWRLKDIINWLPKVKEQGFNCIQISPIQPTKDKGYEWWKLYQPCNFSIGNTQIGSREDLIDLCRKAHEINIEIFVDVVLRHVAGDERNNLLPHKNVTPYLRMNYISDPCNDYHNRNQYITKCTGMPMIEYWNSFIQEQFYKPFLFELKECGVDGIRLDQAKHYKTPEEGCNFLNMINEIGFKFIYGECIFCEKWELNMYAKYINVITEGRPSDDNKLVAFFESHDTYHEFKYTQGLTRDQMITEWSILNNYNNFTNTIFFARPQEAYCSDLWLSKEIKDINLTSY